MLQRVDAPVPQIVLVQQVRARSQPKIARRGCREDALVTDVVDREDGASRRKQPIPGIDRTQEERREGGVPVVAMENIRREPHALAALDGRAREQQEAQVLVDFAGVEVGALVERRAVHQVDHQR